MLLVGILSLLWILAMAAGVLLLSWLFPSEENTVSDLFVSLYALWSISLIIPQFKGKTGAWLSPFVKWLAEKLEKWTA